MQQFWHTSAICIYGRYRNKLVCWMLFGFAPASDVAVTLTMSFSFHMAAIVPVVKRDSNVFLQVELTKFLEHASF